jgi:hypothetical protein
MNGADPGSPGRVKQWRLAIGGRKSGSHSGMIFSRTITVPWDDLDAQACGEDGAPDWDSLIVVGPMKRRDARGHTTLEWTVTVQCRPQAAPARREPSERLG